MDAPEPPAPTVAQSKPGPGSVDNGTQENSDADFTSVIVKKTPADKAKVAKARELEKANAAKAKEEG